MKAKVSEIKEGLKGFGGTNFFYRLPLTGTKFTDGIRYLGEKSGSFWLITYVSAMAKGFAEQSRFITIDFKKLPEDHQDYSGYEGEIIYSDAQGNIIKRQECNITGFPFVELRLCFEEDTLMLPNEY